MTWTRRAFLKSGGLAVFAAGVGGSPLFMSRAAQAAAAPGLYRRRKVLVALFQRGAMDGLMAVPPLEDPHLAAYRPRLALSASRTAEAPLLDLDGRFGLHPALASLKPYFDEGRLAVVHGMGSPNTTRSHFDAQDYMETGTPHTKRTRSGWLNRAVGLAGHDATPFQAVALTQAMPLALYGPAPALSVANLADLKLDAPGGDAAAQAGATLEDLYAQTTQDLLRGTGHDTFEAAQLLERLRTQRYRPEHGARYPRSPLGRSLQQVAQLIKHDVGLEVAFVESNGWDTHVRQGTTTGTFARLTGDLARSIAAFWTDMEGYHDEVVLMTMTEFGRTVRENGAGGTDHGRASCCFTLGNAVAGGRVYGNVPELAVENLAEGRDLPVTTDFRSIFATVAGHHLGITDDAALFPGWTGERLPLMRP